MPEETPQANENQPEDKGLESAKAAGAEGEQTSAPAPKQGADPSKGPKSEERMQAEKRSPKKKIKAEQQGTLWMSRRSFFSRAGWVAFFSFVASFFIGSLRFMFPRVLFEPSPVFKAGYPGDYQLGSVSTKWVREQRVWVVHSEDGIFAILAICTHLGCTPRWLDAENKFKCPCHGSGFNREGVNFEGPAPRPLEHVQVTLAEDGQIVIDKSIKYLEEKGDWGKPGSILQV